MILFVDVLWDAVMALPRRLTRPAKAQRMARPRRPCTPPDCWRDARGQLWRWTRKGWRRRKH